MNNNNLTTLLLITLLVSGCTAHHNNLSVSKEPLTAESIPEIDPSTTYQSNDVSKSLGNAAIDAQISHYTTILAKPTPEQRDPMRVIIEVNVPQDIQTVGQAIDYLLLRSGYHIQPDITQRSEVKRLLDQPLPQVHRKLGPMTLQDALMTLGSSAFELVVNPVERTVAYRFTPDTK